MHVGICNMHVETQHLFLMWDLGIIGLGFVNLGNWEALVLEQLRKWARDVRSGTRARTEHGRSGDPGLWVRQ